MKNVNKKTNKSNKIKYLIIAVLGVILIVALVIFLIKGCKKEEVTKPIEEIKLPEVKPEKPIEIEEIKEEAMNQVRSSAKKVIAQVTKPKYYTVTYNLNTGGTKTIELQSGQKIKSKFLPSGYNTCKYYTNSNLTDEFNFNNPIYNNTNIYMKCENITYDIEYINVITTNNVKTYAVGDSDIALIDPDPKPNEVFLGWYLDLNFSKEIKTITKDVIKYASNNIIKIYAKYGTIQINYYNDSGALITESKLSSRSEKTLTPGSSVCSANDKFLGWSIVKDSNVISYVADEEITNINDSFSLYANCGKATIIYESDGQVVKVGYTKEDIEKYELPEVEEVGLDVPTYYVKADDNNINGKKIISDDALEILENEIKLEDAKKKASSNYTPEVGDKIEEKEKVFDGYEMIEEDNSTTPPTIDSTPVDDPEVVKEEINNQEQETPSEVPEVKLQAQWKEQEEDQNQNNKSNSSTTNTNTSTTNTNTSTDDDENNTDPTNA